MEALKIKFNNNLFNNYLVRIGDLVNFEGPLMSLFEDVRNGHLYIFDWVDRDENCNRWLIFQISPIALLEFVQQKTPYLTLFKSAINNNYYFADISSKSIRLNDYNILFLEEVPNKYFPHNLDYFDKQDCPQYDKILSLTFRRLENKKQENLFMPEVLLKQPFHKSFTINKVIINGNYLNKRSNSYNLSDNQFILHSYDIIHLKQSYHQKPNPLKQQSIKIKQHA